MLISAFEQLPGNFFSIFFLYIKKFYQVLSTCQISDQLDHSDSDYRGGGQNLPFPAIPICKKPGLLRVEEVLTFLIHDFCYLKD